MVGPGVGSSERAAHFAHNAAQVAEKIVFERRGDKRRAVLGAENQVGKQVRVSVRHILSPLRGLGGIFTRFHYPRLAPWATTFRPLCGLADYPINLRAMPY